MAPALVRTARKRLMLAGLNLLARLAGPWLGSSATRDDRGIPRILVVELWNIGDVVLVMPFLAQLRARFPTAEITLLARPHAEELLQGTGLADRFVSTELAWDARAGRNPFSYDWRELRRIHRLLRERGFDIGFQCRPHIREHFILALTGAQRRVGYAFGAGDRLLTDAVGVDDANLHKATAWLELLAPLGGASKAAAPALHVTAAERRWAAEFLSAKGISESDLVVGVHPGASVAEKRWPLDRFRAVTAELAKRPGLRVVGFCEPGGLGESLSEESGVIRASVGLRQLVALIARCDMLVCNDSGPMHIAGALGVPTVAVFQSGIDRLFAPLGDGHELVSAEAGLGGVDVPGVLSAVDRVMQRVGANPRVLL